MQRNTCWHKQLLLLARRLHRRFKFRSDIATCYCTSGLPHTPAAPLVYHDLVGVVVRDSHLKGERVAFCFHVLRELGKLVQEAVAVRLCMELAAYYQQEGLHTSRAQSGPGLGVVLDIRWPSTPVACERAFLCFLSLPRRLRASQSVPHSAPPTASTSPPATEPITWPRSLWLMMPAQVAWPRRLLRCCAQCDGLGQWDQDCSRAPWTRGSFDLA